MRLPISNETLKLINDKKYTVEQAQQYLCISRATLFRHLKSRAIASLKMGGKRFFLGKHLKAFELASLQPARKDEPSI